MYEVSVGVDVYTEVFDMPYTQQNNFNVDTSSIETTGITFDRSDIKYAGTDLGAENNSYFKTNKKVDLEIIKSTLFYSLLIILFVIIILMLANIFNYIN